jgi:hypothetical protein
MSGSGIAMLPMSRMIEPFHDASSDDRHLARAAAAARQRFGIEIAERRHLVLELVDVDRTVQVF